MNLRPKLRSTSGARRLYSEEGEVVVVDIVIADDHALFRSGLRNLLERKQRFNVVGEAASGTEAVAFTSELRPDVLFLDLCLRELSGLDVLQRLGSSSVTRVILLTAGVESNEVVQAFKYGARGILLKSNATEDLFDSIDAVMSGQYWVYCKRAPDLTDALKNSQPPNVASGRFNLTPREFEVIHALVSGCTNREIAQRLSISEQTVKHHVTNIFNKTGSSSRLELALLAFDQRLLTLP